MKKGHIHVSILISALLLVSSCSRQKGAISDLPARSTAEIISKATDGRLDFSTFSAKISSEIITENNKRSFKTTLRLKKDSIIWLSISPALGIEAARLVLTPDSVKALDKIGNRYFLGGYDFVEQQIDTPIDFYLLQDMIMGEAPVFDPEEKFKSSRDGPSYRLTSKLKNRIVQAAYDINDPDSEEEEVLDDAVTRALSATESDVVVKDYWFENEHWRCIRAVVTDLGMKRSAEFQLDEYENLGNKILPKKSRYSFTDLDKTTVFKMSFTRHKLDRELTFPFSIPEKFEPFQTEE